MPDDTGRDSVRAVSPRTATGQGLPMQRAELADAEPLLALREAAATWLAGRGIRQWEPGEVTLQDIRDQVAAGDWFLVRSGGAVQGALRLLWEDEQMWGPQSPDAAYVHGLVINRDHAGLGLGRDMLDWAGQQARRAGRQQLRLDCGEDNTALTAYYHRQGFQTIGRRDLDGRWYSVVLLQRTLVDDNRRSAGALTEVPTGDVHLVVGAVLVREGRALLVHRAPSRRWYPNVWDLPGGHVEPGEDHRAAVIRELREELGVNAEVFGPPIARTVAQDFVMDVWAVRAWTGEPFNVDSTEHDAIAWLSPDHLDGLALAHPDVSKQVLLAINA